MLLLKIILFSSIAASNAESPLRYDCSSVSCLRPTCQPGECLITPPGGCCSACSPCSCNRNVDCSPGQVCDILSRTCQANRCAQIQCSIPNCAPNECAITRPGQCCPSCSAENCPAIASGGCRIDRDCPRGQICNSATNFCGVPIVRPGLASCTGNVDCPPGQICDLAIRRCSENPCNLVQCSIPNCAADECTVRKPGSCCPSCSKEGCPIEFGTYGGGGCQRDSDCQQGNRCDRGVCIGSIDCSTVRCGIPNCPPNKCTEIIPGSCCPSCSEADCTITFGGGNGERISCQSSSGCPQGHSCNGGICGQDCSLLQCGIPDCLPGQCLKTQPGDCCPSCTNKGCRTPQSITPDCETNRDCGQNQTCNRRIGRCRNNRECRNNRDCQEDGEVCRRGRCRQRRNRGQEDQGEEEEDSLIVY